ncbi:hypothetical protein ONS95_002591 [Cadophora gregata]|uniref:uncharacterized protein n=1 Tax=Cadophora gregata TaxID=51156 RepID=UPI0026DC66C2|nr:uncharacterized protein ONS95_002591 [Cadophora gregata]KAK0109920.1 hypothetical protein ONS95_002591 [Cadophora gregata]KAK0110450.1 hypothetical protein ONS96_002061 [Cadophora gregata f. sp. sojae]
MPPLRVYRSIKDQFYVAAVNRPVPIPEERVTRIYEEVHAEVWQEYPDEDSELQCYLSEYYAWVGLFQRYSEYPGGNSFHSLWGGGERVNRHVDELTFDKEREDSVKEICDLQFKNEEMGETVEELESEVAHLKDEIEILTTQLVEKKLEDRLSNDLEMNILALKQELRDAITRKFDYILATRTMSSTINDLNKSLEKFNSANQHLKAKT